MQKKSYRILFSGLLIAFAVDFLFYKKPFGISFLIWISLALVALLVLNFYEKRKIKWPTVLLSLITLVLSSISIIRMEPFSVVISSLLALFSLMLLTASNLNGYWIHFRIVDYVLNFARLFASAFYRAWGLLFPATNAKNDNGEGKHPSSQRKITWALLRGLVLALPVVAVLAALLSSADAVFESELLRFLDIFRVENLAEVLFRIIYVLVLAYLFSGSLMHALYPIKGVEQPDTEKAWMKPFLGHIETIVVLSSVNLLFLTFIIVQFRYFFGGQANISLDGYTYAEYARRGFGELLMVALLSLGLYLVLHTISKKENKLQRNIFSILSIAVFAQVLVMLVSSSQRLSLYESAYGFSRLRTYSHLFIPWLAAVIVAVILLEIIRRQGRFALVLFLSAVGFVLTCGLSNIDGDIARHNIERASQSNAEGYALDRYFLGQLSSDAVPAIWSAYQNSNGDLKTYLGADLTCRWLEIKNSEPRPWQGFNFSYQEASNLLQDNYEEWQRIYPQVEGERGLSIDIDGETWYCNNVQAWD